MAIKGQSNRRKGDIKLFRIEEDRQQDVKVRHEAFPQRKEMSIWAWHEEFAIAWSETFITTKRKNNSRKGE